MPLTGVNVHFVSLDSERSLLAAMGQCSLGWSKTYPGQAVSGESVNGFCGSRNGLWRNCPSLRAHRSPGDASDGARHSDRRERNGRIFPGSSTIDLYIVCKPICSISKDGTVVTIYGSHLASEQFRASTRIFPRAVGAQG
jgi:hypothetical protein